MRSDPMLFDERVDDERTEEAVREARWRDFEAYVTVRATLRDWNMVLCDVISARDQVCDGRLEPTDSQRRYLDFAETEQWSGVLRAIANAFDDFENRRRRDLERC